jgi:predicted DNA-binding transcriptional regulator AlpA/biotin operon repressor
MDRLLPLRALTRLLAVEEATIRDWIAAGRFPAPVALPDGQERWRSSAVTAWQASLGTARQQRCPVDLKNLPELAQEILQVLEEADDEWVSGAEIHAKTGADGDHHSGNFQKQLRRLRQDGLIESSARGYRLTAVACGEGNGVGNGDGNIAATAEAT